MSIKRRCHGLRDLLELQERSAAAWVAPGSCRGGFGEFWRVLKAGKPALNLHKRTLPRLQWLVGAAGKVCRGLSGAWELQGRVWGVLASFEGWRTGALNLLKRTLPRLAGKVCRGLSGAWELQGKVWGVLEAGKTAALNVHKKTLPRPQGLVGAAGKVCRGLSGAWELQGRVWGVLKAGKRQPWTSIKRHCHGLRHLWELQERSAAAWVAPGSCRGGFGEFWRVLKAGKRQPWTSLLPRPQGLVGTAQGLLRPVAFLERRRNRDCCGMSGSWEVHRNCSGLSGSWAVNRGCYGLGGSWKVQSIGNEKKFHTCGGPRRRPCLG